MKTSLPPLYKFIAPVEDMVFRGRYVQLISSTSTFHINAHLEEVEREREWEREKDVQMPNKFNLHGQATKHHLLLPSVKNQLPAVLLQVLRA